MSVIQEARKAHNSTRGVKILATIGPSSSSVETVKDMIKSGVSGFRINMSFGDADTWSSYLKIIIEASEELDAVVSIIGDIPGPQVRSGGFSEVQVSRGDAVYLSRSPGLFPESIEVPVTLKEFYSALEPGDTVLYGDGEVELRVIDVGRDFAKCIATGSGTLKPGRKLVVQGKELPLPFLSGKDLELINYICKNKFTYIALSYVRDDQDILLAKGVLDQYNCRVNILSKIETPSGVKNVQKICELSDAVLIARGDLGVHFPIEDIPIVQEQIARAAVQLGKPVVVATDILDSMIEGHRPSRSDVIGVYSTVYNLVDAILLTNETAIGKYPVEAVKWARAISDKALQNMPEVLVEQLRKLIKSRSLLEKYVHGLISLAESLNGSIIVYTRTGRIAPLVARLRPKVSTYVGSWNRKLLEKYTIYYGIQPVDISSEVSEQGDHERGVKILSMRVKDKGYLKTGDVVVESYAKPGLNVHEIRVEVLV
ncbi:MAG: pyruvate kinase [Desulfurococcaceae archaeon]